MTNFGLLPGVAAYAEMARSALKRVSGAAGIPLDDVGPELRYCFRTQVLPTLLVTYDPLGAPFFLQSGQSESV